MDVTNYEILRTVLCMTSSMPRTSAYTVPQLMQLSSRLMNMSLTFSKDIVIVVAAANTG